MDRIDFTNQPDGFPLESDATLGFLQTLLREPIEALAKLAGADNIILTGLVETGGVYSDGWIFYDGEVLFFEGGAEATNFIIEQTVTQKANQDGTQVDRYFERKARFGSGSGEVAFSTLKRINDLENVMGALFRLADGGGVASNFTILSGLTPISGGTGGIQNGYIMYNGRLMLISTYNATAVNESNPVYLSPDGSWSTSSSAGALRFSPYVNHDSGFPVRLKDKQRDAQHDVGFIMWVKDADVPADQFDGTGLGEYHWERWALANGNNGTVDLSSAITGLTAIERIS